MVRKLTRSVKACTNCRQQKIRCDASETLPDPCRRCAKMGKECTIDPEFKPRKGSQVDLLREEIAALKREVLTGIQSPQPSKKSRLGDSRPRTTITGHHDSALAPLSSSPKVELKNTVPEMNTAPPTLHSPQILPQPTAGPYILENVTIGEQQAQQLHTIFVADFLPSCRIFETNSCGELYTQSEMLFWTVMITAASSNPTPELYLRLVDPLRRLVAKTCYLETPRSTHVVQALVILANWGLPNEKISDDPSYRYITLARSIAMQLGLHRGKFIYEFTRKQKLMPNAVKWRTHTWTQIYITEQLLSAVLGVPSNMRVDFLIEEAADKPLPLEGDSALLKLSMWYSNMASLMGSSTRTPDGLLNSRVRMPSIEIFAHGLDAMDNQFSHEPPVRICYEYCRLLLYMFAFLPGSSESDQGNYICPAFESATRLITLARSYVGKRRMSEFPTLIRQATTFAAFLLFKLHVLPQFPRQFFESARQSVVTVHHLYRNVSQGWGSVNSDITRAAKILESLNVTLINYPYLLTGPSLMVMHMRSHLSYSLFYEIVWTIHEARRRNAKANQQNMDDISNIPQPLRGPEKPPDNVRALPPLPLFNQISTEDYASSTYTSPNGTTMTMLVPAHGTVQDQVSQPAAFNNEIGHQLGTPMPMTQTALNMPKEGDADVDALLQGIDWMGYEGDDILGWVPNAEFPI